MESKNILILLISFTLLINFINYIDKDETKTLKKIEALKKRLAKEQQLLSNQKRLKPINNIPLFFDAKANNNALLGVFQKEVKAIAQKAEFKITNITWGEAILNTPLNLVTIPLRVSAKSTPRNFAKFLQALREMERIVKMDMIRISKSRKEINYQFYLFGYKRVDNVEK